MDSIWKVLVFFAVIITIGFTVFDLMIAMDPNPSLSQYQIEDANLSINTQVLQHIADSSGLVYVYTEEIGIPAE